jgi:uncharacterized protein with GYD domain
MATFVSLFSFTDQGIRTVKESPARVDAFKATASKLGVTVKSVLYTLGNHDLVVTMEGSDEAVTTLMLKIGSNGNVKTQTLRAYTQEEFARMLGKMP